MTEHELVYLGSLTVALAGLAFGVWSMAWGKGHWAFYIALALIAFGMALFLYGYEISSRSGLVWILSAFAAFFLSGGLFFGLAGAWLVQRLRRR